MNGVSQQPEHLSKPDGLMRIVPGDTNNPYFIMPRTTAQDKKLSFEARGMLVYLLSKPSDWQVRPKDLEQECGRARVYRILKELETSRYIERAPIRDSGRLSGWEYRVYASPRVENDHKVPRDHFQHEEIDHYTYYREEQNTEELSMSEPATAVPTVPPSDPQKPEATDHIADTVKMVTASEAPIPAELPPLSEIPDPWRWTVIPDDPWLIHGVKPTPSGKRLKPAACGRKAHYAEVVNSTNRGRRLECGECQRVLAAEETKAAEAKKPKVNQCLIDAVAVHIQQFARPELANAYSGVLAGDISQVWSKYHRIEGKLTAEQYQKMAASIPVFIRVFKADCEGCNIPTARDTLSNNYTRLLPKILERMNPQPRLIAVEPDDYVAPGPAR